MLFFSKPSSLFMIASHSSWS
uniref:Uncharacterized protein n=1 Tax=Arundo donax TaxID=35708 RepID=A0A0A8YBD3_ARUDO